MRLATAQRVRETPQRQQRGATNLRSQAAPSPVQFRRFESTLFPFQLAHVNRTKATLNANRKPYEKRLMRNSSWSCFRLQIPTPTIARPTRTGVSTRLIHRRIGTLTMDEGNSKR